MRYLPLLLVLCVPAYGDDEINEVIEIIETKSYEENLSGITTNNLCSESSAMANNKCDFYAQTCFDKDGEYPEKDVHGNLVQTQKDRILIAYDKYAKVMGKKDFNSLIKEELSQFDIFIGDLETKEEGSQKSFIKSEKTFSELMKSKPEFIEPSDLKSGTSCDKETNKLKEHISKLKKQEEELSTSDFESVMAMVDLNKRKMRDDLQKKFLVDPLLTVSYITELCGDAEDEETEKTKTLKDKCKPSNIYAAKSTIYGLEKAGAASVETSTAIQELLIKYDITDKVYEYDKIDETQTPKQKLDDIEFNITYPSCYYYDMVQDTVNEEIFSTIMEKVNTSRVVVEDLIEAFAGSAHDKAYNEFESFKVGFLDVLDEKMVKSGVIKDESKLNMIREEYKSLTFDRFKLPNADVYHVVDGQEYLNREKVFVGFAGNPNQTLSNFFMPNLEYFTTLNASYMPKIDKISEEQINIMPMFVEYYNKNPLSTLEVLGHELGHKIGPEVSDFNEHNLRNELAPLMSCMKSQESFSMKFQQTEETFSDWISAEVMAKHIEKNYTPEQYREATMNTVRGYCLFNAVDGQAHSSDGVHPDSVFRINAIFGAHPFYKKAMGCESDDTYKYCSLEGEE